MVLASHLNATERYLVALAGIQENAGHTLHKGTPREVFIREFLSNHLAATVDVGTGEVIDANSKPGERRNQIDAVVYRREYPKLDFGGGITGFLVESLVAAIEVKSTLDRSGVMQAVGAARRLKQLIRNTSPIMRYGNPSLLPKCIIVAFDGPTNIGTVHDWVEESHKELGISIPTMPPTSVARQSIPSPGLDGVFILRKGFVHFVNQPFEYRLQVGHKNR